MCTSAVSFYFYYIFNSILTSYSQCFSGVCVGTSCKKITSQMLAMMDHDQDYCEHFHKEICQESERITTNNLPLTKYFTQLKSYLYNISQSNSPTHSSFLNVYQSCLNNNMEFDFEKRMRFGKYINIVLYLRGNFFFS